MQAAQLQRSEIHGFLIQIKIQLARPPSLTRMEAIFDLQTNLGKFGSWLRKSGQVCAEIWYYVVDAEQAIQRIEQQLRAATPVAGNVGSTPRILASGKSRPQGASQEETRDDFTARLRGPLRPR
ncbi:MAG: hypothetical protein ACJ8F0_01630 [Xanthobacteraceae bacterium]|jgi:hypothetical protein